MRTGRHQSKKNSRTDNGSNHTNEYSIEGGGLAYSCHAFVNMLEQVGHDITIISSSVPDVYKRQWEC